MNKLIKTILLLIMLIGLALPYGISLLLEREYNRCLAKLNQTAPNFVVVGEFSTGWFSSKAKTHVTAKENSALTFALELEHNIKNGPIIIDLENSAVKISKLALVDSKISNKQFLELSKLIYPGQNGLIITTELEFDGTANTTIKNLPFQYTIGNGEIQWSGLGSTLQYDRQLSFLIADISMPKIAFKEGQNQITLQTFKYALGQKQTKYGMYAGEGEIAFEQFAIKSATDTVLAVDKFKFTGKNMIENNVTSVDFKLSIENIFEFSSKSKIGPLSIALNISNLDTPTLKKLSDSFDKLKQFSRSNPEQVKLWLEVLAKQPTVKLQNTAINTAHGKLTVDLQAKIGAANMPSLEKQTLLQTMQATAKIEIAKALAYELTAKKIERDINTENQIFDLSHEGSQMPKPNLTPELLKIEIENRVLATIKKLVEEKIIVEQEKTFVIDILMKDSSLKVNGSEIPLPF